MPKHWEDPEHLNTNNLKQGLTPPPIDGVEVAVDIPPARVGDMDLAAILGVVSRIWLPYMPQHNGRAPFERGRR